METVTVLLAFSGGLIAFLSPCTIPLYPSFISYITGVSVNDISKRSESFSKSKTLFHTIFFSLGFSSIYYILGFSLSYIGNFFKEYQTLIQMLGGIFLVIMGLFLTGVLKFDFFYREWKFKYIKNSTSYFNSFLVGFIFAAGWTPCIGPIFGAIMYASILNPTQTFLNITFYSLGFCIPFIIMAFFVTKTKLLNRYSNVLMKIGGSIMILIGIMIFFDKMFYFNALVSNFQYYIEDLFRSF